MINIRIDDVKKKWWEKVKQIDILHVETADGNVYQINLIPLSTRKQTEDGDMVA